MEKAGRRWSLLAPRLYMPSSLVITQLGEPSLPAAAMVRMVPMGNALAMGLP
ncbi:hypothetical protein D3C81_2342400 [compost metagenome]